MAHKEPRKLAGLYWRDLRHLEKNLNCRCSELQSIIENIDKCYHVHSAFDAKGKRRTYSTPHGRLRAILDLLNRRLQRVQLDESVHGAVRKRSYVTNARPHAAAPALVKCDIKDFFPSIRPNRVYRTFVDRLGCSPDVSRLLTRLVTYRGTLPMGSPTSPVVAAIVSEPLARRLRGLGESRGGTATLYVDDGTISGPLRVARTQQTAERILRQEGFQPHPTKCCSLVAEKPKVVTGVRVDGGIDVPTEKAEAADVLLDELESSISRCEGLDTAMVSAVRGKIQYIRQLNPGRGRRLLNRLDAIIDPSSTKSESTQSIPYRLGPLARA